MNFERPPQADAQEHSPEDLREKLRSLIESVNDMMSQNASLDIDEIDKTQETVSAQIHLISTLFQAAEDEPEALLELVDGIVDRDTRRDVWKKSVVRLGAIGATEAFEAKMKAHELWLNEVGIVGAVAAYSTESLRKAAADARVAYLLEKRDVPGAARAYLSAHEGATKPDRKLEEAVRAYVENAGELPEQIENYNRLPDRFPGMGENDFARKLYQKMFLGMGREGMSAREAKEICDEKFRAAPDILARNLIWSPKKNPEQALELFKAVRDKGDRESVLSYFLQHHFSPEGFQEAKPDLFEAYKKFKPENILDRIEAFSDQFEALPEEERRALVDGWIAAKPEMLVFRLGKTLRLDEKDLERTVDRILETAPFRLFDPEFGRHLGWTEHQIVQRCLIKGLSTPLLSMVEDKLSDEGLAELFNGMAAKHPLEVAAVPSKVRIDPEAAQKGLEVLLLGSFFEEMSQFEEATNARFDAKRLSEETLRRIKLTDIPELIAAYPEATERLALAGIVGKLEKIQGRAARSEYDAWEQELDPLLAAAYEKRLLSPEKKEDADLFLEFVKEFGAVNTPKLFETYVGLKRAKSVEEIPEGVRKMLEETLGKKRVEKMKTPAFLLNEIRKFDRGMVSALLEDKIPAGMTSELGLELFGQKKGASNWGQDDDPKELIEKWESFRKASPEDAAVPEGYVETRLSVPLMERGGKDPKLAAILERPEVLESFYGYIERIQPGFPGNVGLEDVISAFIDTHPEATAFIDAARLSPDDGAYNLDELVGMMEALRADESAEAAVLLARLSARHAWAVAPDGRARAFQAMLTDEPPVPDDVKRLRDLLVDYVSEHYLHPSQETHRTGHEPFSPELRAALEKAWGLADKDANPVIKAFNDMEALKKNGKASGKKKAVALVPAQGLLRVYGGDLADACYTSRHNELAEGKYPDLHAMIFVTGRGTASERFAGSALFVETETTPEAGGKKVLMVRANNPRENLIQDVNADALIRQTLDEAIETAKRRGLDMVVVPLDQASNSSSNRPAVSRYYQEHFSDVESVALQRKAETNFNGYPNWDPDSGHGVVVVWSRETEERGREKEPG